VKRQAALTGWLYADLLLALFVVFLAATTGAPVVTGQAGARPSPSPSPTPTPTPVCTRSVALQKHELFTTAGAGTDGVPSDDQLRSQFAQFNGQVAGLVLTFTHAPTAGDGQNLSSRVNDRLRRLYPTLLPSLTIMENYATTDSDVSRRGAMSFDVYLLSQPCSP
jgi:hypothetical protein